MPVLALAAAASPPLHAQTVTGRVVEDGRGTPVAGARVSLLDRDGKRRAEVVADSLGRFVMTPPRDGEYVLAAERLGYQTMRSPLLALKREGSVEMDLLMQPEPIGLEGLEVSVQSEIVRELRTLGQSPASLGRRWIPREDIAAVTSAIRTSDVIRWRAIPGVYIPVTNGSPNLEPLCVTTLRAGTVRAATPPCGLTVLNGVVINPLDANQLDPEAIEAIAVLPPVEATTLYGTLGGAGAVLIWTRRGGAR